MLTTTHIDVFSDILHNIYHLHLVIKLQTFLREIAKTHGIADIEFATIGSHLSQQHLDECRLTCTIVPNDSHFLKSREVIVEVL